VSMEQLPPMQPAENFEDAGDLAPDERFGPARGIPAQKNAQIAEARVLEGETVQQLALRGERKDVVDANRARVAVEQLAEIRFPHPAVNSPADLDADGFWNGAGSAEPPREIDLPEAALAKQTFDPIRQAGLGAGDDLRRYQQRRLPAEQHLRQPSRARRRRREA